MFYVPRNIKQITQAYISKYNDERDNQVKLLMITDETNNWHYIAVKSIFGLLRRRTLNHNRDFVCSNCFHSYTMKKKLKKHEKTCKNHDFCNIRMPNEDNKISK